MRKILFIVNPVSGTKNKYSMINFIKDYLSTKEVDFDVYKTEYPGHGKEIVDQNLSKGFDTFVAVGGDGTINEVAELLIGKDKSLGIIRTGSGNGLARTMKIPSNLKKALDLIIKGNTELIDSVSINDKYFFNVAGTGFDAHISSLFSKLNKRGLSSYLRLIIKEFFGQKSQNIGITINGINTDINYFMLSFANSPQFGNNAYISPLSKCNDGKIEMVIVKKFKLSYFPIIAFMVYFKMFHKSKFTKYIVSDSFVINGDKSILFHIDGDPISLNLPLTIKVIPGSLKIISKN